MADGLAVTSPGAVPFAILREIPDDAATVTDAEIVGAMRLLIERAKQVVEPSGPAALAAVLAGRVGLASRAGGRRRARPRDRIVLSGGNVGADQLAALLG